MAPQLGLGHTSPSSYHPSKGESIPPTRTPAEAEAIKATLPKVISLDANTATVDEIVEAMKIAGGLVIRNAVSHEALDQIEKDMRPKLDEDAPWEGDFFPKETRRGYQLLGSPTCAREVIMHPLYQATCDKFLTTKNWFWSGDQKTYSVSKPQIMNTVCFSINPGAHKQPLHRDDWCYHVVAEKVDVYPEDLQRDTGIGWFVAGKDATFENGCTRFIPGSHLWEHERQPDDALCAYAELKRGDAFMMFASCYHGGGANTTKDQERLLFSCFMTRGWLRQEENQYISFTREQTLKMDKDVQKIAGYQLSEPFLGWVKSTDPMVVLDPSVGVGNQDLFKKDDNTAF